MRAVINRLAHAPRVSRFTFDDHARVRGYFFPEVVKIPENLAPRNPDPAERCSAATPQKWTRRFPVPGIKQREIAADLERVP